MGTITKGKLGKQDCGLYDGTTRQFTRSTATGGSESISNIDWAGVDALHVFGDGATCNDATIRDAISQIGTSREATLFMGVEGNDWILESNLNVPNNISLDFSGGATIDGAFTLSFNTSKLIANSTRPCFGADITVTGLIKAYPDWWIKNAVAGTTDMTDGITKADAAAYTVRFNPTTYLYTTVAQTAGRVWAGNNHYSTTLQSTTTGNTITMAADSSLRRLTIDGVSKVAGSVGVYGAVNRTRMREVTIKRFETNEKRQSGIFCSWADVYRLQGVYGLYVYTDGSAGFNQNKMLRGRISENSTTGLHLEYAGKTIEGLSIDTVDFESNGTGAVLRGTYDVGFNHAWFEGNTTNHLDIDDSGAVYNTLTSLDHCILNTLVGGGVALAGTNINFTVKRCFLNSHTWTINQSRWFELTDCYDSGCTFTYTTNRMAIKTSTSSWYNNIVFGSTDCNYAKITINNHDWEWIFSSVSTTDATQTTLDSFTLATGTSFMIDAEVTAQSTANTDSAVYHIKGLFKNSGGTVTQIGSTQAVITAIESDATFDCVFDISGTAVRIRVTGAAGKSLEWAHYSRIHIR